MVSVSLPQPTGFFILFSPPVLWRRWSVRVAGWDLEAAQDQPNTTQKPPKILQ